MKRFFFFFQLIQFIIVLQSYNQVVSEWRGIGRTGLYNDSTLLKEWPDNGPELLWVQPSLAFGYSSVSVYDSTIYLTGSSEKKEILIALNLDGSIKWETAYGRSWNESFRASRCTPTVENNKVFVTSGLGEVACIDAIDGRIIWFVAASEKYEGSYGMYGISESPIVIGNKLIFTPGGDITTMIALNKETGETIWQSESINDKPSYASPVLINFNGIQLIIAITERFIIGVIPENGKILWRFEYSEFASDKTFNINATTPLYDNGNIFVTSGYNHANVMLKLNQNASAVTLMWTDTILDNHFGGIVHIGNSIYGSNWINNNMGNWVCLDWNSGNLNYEAHWKNKGAIISDGNMLYCQEEKSGYIGLVPVNSKKFCVISSFKVPYGTGSLFAHPVIHNGILYIRRDNALLAYKLKLD